MCSLLSSRVTSEDQESEAVGRWRRRRTAVSRSVKPSELCPCLSDVPVQRPDRINVDTLSSCKSSISNPDTSLLQNVEVCQNIKNISDPSRIACVTQQRRER